VNIHTTFFEKSSDNFTPWHPQAQAKALLRGTHHAERRRTPFEKESRQVENPTRPPQGRAEAMEYSKYSTARPFLKTQPCHDGFGKFYLSKKKT